jgi:hypothetical protein
MSSAEHEVDGLRLRLRFEEEAADLASLPWEARFGFLWAGRRA